MGDRLGVVGELTPTAESLCTILALSRNTGKEWKTYVDNKKRYYECDNLKVAFDTSEPYPEPEPAVAEPDHYKQEFITLGPPTAEEIAKVMSETPSMIVDHPPVIRDITLDEFKTAVECGADFVAVMVCPELDLVLKGVLKRLKHVSPAPLLSWELGRLAINGARTKLRACEVYDALKALSRFGSHETASDAVAQVLAERISELF